jgi:hypothetical protein
MPAMTREAGWGSIAANDAEFQCSSTGTDTWSAALWTIATVFYAHKNSNGCDKTIPQQSERAEKNHLTGFSPSLTL